MNVSSILRRFSYFSRRLLVIGTIFAILLATSGSVIRDRTIVLAFMMYIPLLLLGLWAILLDFWLKGYSLPKFRFGLTFIGLSLAIWGGLLMIGTGNSQTHITSSAISLLHWNVKWGGIGYDNYLKKQYQGEEWASIRQAIYQRHPDIIVLSEPPQVDAWLKQLTKQMGTGWTMLRHDRSQRNGLAIFSSKPLQFERLVKIRRGTAMSVVVTVQNQPLRLLLIDCERSVRKLKTPQLTDIIQAVIENDQQEKPIDMIVGDFNAVSRSIGFDSYAYVAGGYQLAGQQVRGWRGTWPFILPLYDIDHVWIHNRFQILKVEMFTNLYTDHRGQQVYFSYFLKKSR